MIFFLFYEIMIMGEKSEKEVNIHSLQVYIEGATSKTQGHMITLIIC